MEAPTSDQSTAAEWGCYGETISGATGQAISTGYANTQAIINGNCSDSTDAANLCWAQKLGNGIKTDWFLPSLDELIQLLNERSIVGFPVGSSPAQSFAYWSSSNCLNSETTSYYAYYTNTNTGYEDAGKESTYHIRCVRSGP
jgi:hypothetical protein